MRAVALLPITALASCVVAAPRGHGDPVTIGCIELYIARGTEPDALGPAIDYQFSNRCDHDARLDFSTIRAVVRDDTGARIALHAFDPRDEIHALSIGGGETGRESIEYDLPAELHLTPRPICVDLGQITTTTQPAERWACTGQ